MGKYQLSLVGRIGTIPSFHDSNGVIGTICITGKRATVHSLSSTTPNRGHAAHALRQIKAQFGHIDVVNAGAPGSTSMNFFLHMLAKGIVDSVTENHDGLTHVRPQMAMAGFR
jgi:hypothetical protein